ncbi:MAG: universal stress protein [Parvibaculum sp.]|nr:universal stress protein [Parvibaculum sp.]
MYRTILLAYDGSRQGREALQQGTELASLCQARIYLLAVVAHELGVALAEAAAPSDLPEREYQEVRSLLTETAKTLQASGLLVETRLAVGNPAEEIGGMAREVGAELIVVGHREQTALARWWRGSTGASLLAHAPCSLLVAVSKGDRERR